MVTAAKILGKKIVNKIPAYIKRLDSMMKLSLFQKCKIGLIFENQS